VLDPGDYHKVQVNKLLQFIQGAGLLGLLQGDAQ
jgi:hypothetical protein